MTETARASSLATVLECMLDEVRLALRECMSGLTHDQLWSHPIPGRHSIGVITEHLLYALDSYCGELQTGKMAYEHEPAFSVYGMTIEEIENGITNRFTAGEFFERIDRVCDSAVAGVHGISDSEMLGPRHAFELSEVVDRSGLEFCLGGIFHAHGHIRQIWLLRGAMGLTTEGEHQWPTWQYG